MIIPRQLLFSKRRNLTSEELEDIKLRNQILKEEYSKLGISHKYSKDPTFRGQPKGVFIPKEQRNEGMLNTFESPLGKITQEEEIDQIKEVGKNSPKLTKKVVKSLKKGKRGIVSLDPRSTSDVPIHEAGHRRAMDNAETEELKRVAQWDKSPSGPRIVNNLKDAESELESVRENMNNIVRREEMANEEGIKLLKEKGKSKETIDKFISRRQPKLNNYKSARDKFIKEAENQIKRFKK